MASKQVVPATKGTTVKKNAVMTDKQYLDLLMADFVAQYGPRAARWLSEVPDKARTSTGIDQLDIYLGGGVILGGTVEVFGNHGVGKTSVALSIASHVDGPVAYMDAERKLEQGTVKRFGDPKKFMLLQPPYLEKAFEWTYKLLLTGKVKMIVFDSLPSFIPKRQLDETDMEKQPGVALTAGFLARIMGMFNAMADNVGATILIVNQNRVNQNMTNMYADPFHQFGGLMLPSIASMRLKVSKGLDLKPGSKTYDPIGIYGHNLSIRVAKSSVGPSQQMLDVPLVYTRGFVDQTDLHATKEQLLAEFRAGTYFPVRHIEIPPEITVEEVHDTRQALREMRDMQEDE